MINTTGVKKYLLVLLCLVCFAAFGQKDTAKHVFFSDGGKRSETNILIIDGHRINMDSVNMVLKRDSLMGINILDTAIMRQLAAIREPGDPSFSLTNQLTIKLNPGLLISEQGLSIQYNLTYNFGILLGGGYNEDNSGNAGFHTYDGSGYTIRAGILQYLDPAQKWYFSFQGFYRYYGNLNAVAQDAQGFTQGIDDQVINPLRQNLNNVTAGDGDKVDVYHAKARIICFDAVWGYQLRKRHFVLDVFGGFGSREKNIRLKEVGYYVNAIGNVGPMISYSSVQKKTIDDTYLDVKLGFTLGYRFY